MSNFEENFLRERLADLRESHPGEAQLAEDLIDAIAFENGKLNDHSMAKNMIFTMCQQLARRSDRAIGSIEGWLKQFVGDGALSQTDADGFIYRAKQLINDVRQ